jgi:hypothetical protein
MRDKLKMSVGVMVFVVMVFLLVQYIRPFDQPPRPVPNFTLTPLSRPAAR